MRTFDRRTVLGALGAAGCMQALGSGREQRPRQAAAVDEPKDALAQVVACQTGFALALHRALVEEAPERNAFHSPLSVWTALALLHEGAQGTTRVELARTLGVQRTAGGLRVAGDPVREGVPALRARLEAAREHVTLSTADALWFDRGFALNPATLATLRTTFGAEAEPLDFRGAPEPARARINAWVHERTAGKIEDLLPAGAVTPSTRLVLTDAVHFLGRWRSPFDPGATRESHFRRADGSTVAVPFMHLAEAASFPLASFDAAGEPRPIFAEPGKGSTWIELPYRGEGLALTVALPDRPDGLPELERQLDAEMLGQRLGSLRPTSVKLRLPRVSLQPKYDLVAPLRKLGVVEAFVAGSADLGGFGAPGKPGAPGARELYVTGAFHAASLTVDEAGSEAAAATGIVVGVLAATPFVSIDRPFLFLIRERSSGAVLFVGRVLDPSP